jgi:hypothetical protein
LFRSAFYVPQQPRSAVRRREFERDVIYQACQQSRRSQPCSKAVITPRSSTRDPFNALAPSAIHPLDVPRRADHGHLIKPVLGIVSRLN